MTRARQLYSEFKQLNTEFIVINVDNMNDTKEFFEELNCPPYSFISDVNRIAIDGYGVTDPKITNNKIISLAATIVISQNGDIIYEYIGSHRERPDLEEALHVLKSLI